MIGAVWKLIIYTKMVNRIINISSNKRIIAQVYDTCLQMFDMCTLGHTAHIRRQSISCHPLISMSSCDCPALFPLQRHPVIWNCWYQRLMLFGTVGSLLNCHRIDSWTETTDLCLTNCNTQNAFRSGVDMVTVLRHRPREKRGMGLRTSRKLEHLLFHSMWKTYFCMRFQSRDGRLKPLQSFWYTLCVYSLPYLEWY